MKEISVKQVDEIMEKQFYKKVMEERYLKNAQIKETESLEREINDMIFGPIPVGRVKSVKGFLSYEKQMKKWEN